MTAAVIYIDPLMIHPVVDGVWHHARLEGVPDPGEAITMPDTPGTAPADVLLSTADRQAALTEVEAAITSGRVDPQAWDGAAAWIDQAVRQRELDALAADLELRAGPAERDATRAELDQALADGRLTPAEHTDRARAAAAADTDHELAALLADLHRPRRGRRRSEPADHRVSHRERDEAARALRRAHAKGQLDLAEYDDRVAAAYAAATRLELDNLLADLREPTAPAEPDIIDYIYQRFDHWHRYSTGTPHMALTPRDKAPRPGIADILLHKRPWQVVMILTWGGYLCWLLATLIHALLGGGWDRVLLPVVLVTPVVVLTDFYTYAVVRRTIRRRRLSRPH
ncbi:protein of unknown function [Amycolatopsis tolypomycina]|uniref:DUF1707 domain-containing protein n=1 Tax=Amycolatopsis tolypomycina TaxID=208445 RepID=A0A1H4Z962_9PSEU|nr:DUF1707 domain-containing protein [Amycolatopsis tolypomycina]SED26786.1 protein of unknown function [Amycolatopsis tolypomycina]